MSVVVEEMNLYCSSSSVLVMKYSEKSKRIKYCNEQAITTKELYSHEHLITIKFKNMVTPFDLKTEFYE